MSSFKKFVGSFWSIRKDELALFWSRTIQFFCILSAYSSTRIWKDLGILGISSNVIEKAGSALIPFVKMALVVPFSMLIMAYVSRVSANCSREKRFPLILMPFVIYFLIHGFVLVPCVEFLQPSIEVVDSLISSYPSRFAPVFLLAGNWVYVLFFCFAEGLSVAGISVAFWSDMNSVTPSERAGRLYPVMGLFANFALFYVGIQAKYVGEVAMMLLGDGASKHELWVMSTRLTCGIASLLLLISIISFHWMNKNVLSKMDSVDPTSIKKKAPKKKYGFVEGFKLVWQNKVARKIWGLMFIYGLIMNVMESPYKGSVSIALGGDKLAMGEFYGTTTAITGVIVLFVSIFLGSTAIGRFGWTKVALTNPIALLLFGGVGFFGLSIVARYAPAAAYMVFANPMYIAICLGALARALSQALKYTASDATREMLYLILQPEEFRAVTKSILEFIGGRLGKSIGSLLVVGSLTIMGTSDMNNILPFLEVVFVIAGVAWCFIVLSAKNEMSEYLEAEKKK